jgi:hypothetical protein
MASILRAHHADAGNVMMRVVPEAEHNEAAWRAEFPLAVRWLLDAGAKRAAD